MDQATSAPDPAIGQGEPDVTVTASPAGQKRARDYGEELKGLTPSGDEGSQEVNSSPAPKKQKRDHRGDASDSGDLDDGEIVESSPPTGPVESPRQSQSPVDEQSWRGSEVGTTVREGQGLQDPRRPNEPPPAAIDNQQQQPVPRSGWNHGVSLGLRTSFGKGRPATFPTKSPVVVESAPSSPVSLAREDGISGNPTGPDVSTKANQKDKARSLEPAPTFEASNLTWNFPLKTAVEVDTSDGEAQERPFWLQRLKPWVLILLQANINEVSRLTHKVVRAGFEIYLTRKMGYLRGTKKQANSARVAAQEAMSSLSKKKVENMISEARDKINTGNGEENLVIFDGFGDNELGQSPADDDVQSPSSENSAGEETRQQRKYFPGAEDPSQYCLSCSAMGHRAQGCPQNNCRFCNSTSHNAFGCPTRRRCTKCHQLGHSVEVCEERLALAQAELDGCAICGADHEDGDCSEIWRSFNPLETIRKKVKSIPSFCYNCGAENHYGPECGLPSRGRKVTGPTTWSQANRELYIDSESQDTAVGWVGIGLNQVENRVLSEFRRATRTTHTHFVSSDESEEELIHAPVNRARTRGEIKIASNIGSISQGRNGGSSWQPPLPPGPPPPPPNGSQSSLPSAPHSLPPRPRTFGAGGDVRPANRTSRGGRGGSRSRSRGRGRGR